MNMFNFIYHSTTKHIFLLQLTLVSLIFYLLYFDIINTVFNYAILIILLSLIYIISISRITTKTILLHSFILFISIRLIYFVATQFKVIPQGDPYWDLATLNIFLMETNVKPISKPPIPVPAEILSWYSSWPLLHIVEMISIKVSSANIYIYHMLFPFLISSVLFIFVYLIIREISLRLKLSLKFMYFTLLLYAVSPDTIYYATITTRQSLGWLFFTIILFLLIKLLMSKNKLVLIPLFIMSVSIIYTHHWSATMLIITLIGIIVLKFVSNNNIFNNNVFISLLLILILCTVIWWTTYGQIIWQAPFFKSISEPFRFDVSKGLRIISYPTELAPQWAVIVLNMRDILLYIPSVIGWYIISRKYNKDNILSLLLALFVIMIVISFLNFVSRGGEFIRVLSLFNIIIIIMTSFVYFNLPNYIRIRLDYIFIIFVFISTVSFLGLWGHSFMLLHLYDKSIYDLSIGEHNYRISSSQINLINEKLSSEDIDRIVTDNISFVITHSKPELYNKIMLLYYDVIPVKDNRSIVVSTDNLYIYKYFRGYFANVDPTERVFIKDLLNDRLKKFDRIYSDSLSVRIWY